MPPSSDWNQGRKGTSKALASVALASFVLGGLFLCVSCLMFSMVVSVAFPNRLDFPPRLRPLTTLDQEDRIVVTLASLIPGVIGLLLVFAGVGLWMRRRWGRTLALGVGGFLGILAMFALVGFLIELLDRGELTVEDPIGPVIGGVGFALYAGYAALIYATLVRKSVAAEFGRTVRNAHAD